jgi:hypothetical protein
MPWAAAGQIIGRNIAVADYGIYSGTYLATKVGPGKSGRWCAVELEKPRNPLKKALGGTSTDTAGLGAGAGVTSLTATSSVPEKVQRVKNYIDGVTRKKGLYLWGGAGPDRFDCSGFASAVGKVMGVVSSRLTTGPFSTFGEAGEGQYVTFWVRETGVPTTSHMYVTVKEGGRLRVAEAGGIRGAPTGWRGSESAARRAGFKPRHAKGW